MRWKEMVECLRFDVQCEWGNCMGLKYKRIKNFVGKSWYFKWIDVLQDVGYVMYRMIYVKKKKMVEDGR